jgi:methyltransferase (TIGR00027 family)
VTARPSPTAARVAVHRARHQLWDDPRVFVDPLALEILGAQTAEELQRHGRRGDDARSRTMRAFLAARSRLTEDALSDAVARGVRQYVMLGAGLETFGYRNPYPGVCVFEVDHPVMQAWKRDMLCASGIHVPDSIQFAACDFDHKALPDALARAGFDATEPTFVSWLGVSAQLQARTTLNVLDTMSRLPTGSCLTFDYVIDRELLTPSEWSAFDALATTRGTAGEPLRGFFHPARLHLRLREMGFSRIEDLNWEALNDRYFQSRADGLRVLGPARLLTAWR